MQDVEMTFVEWQSYRNGILAQRLADVYDFTSIIDITIAIMEERVVVGNHRVTGAEG